MLLLRRPPTAAVAPPEPDAVQRAALRHRGGLLRVLGAPGTGKTTLAVELVADRVARDGLAPDSCLVLTGTRRSAGELRERVTTRLGHTSTEPLARTWSSFGFGLLRQAAALAGEPTPRLLSGPEQDVVLRELLSGHASGAVPGPVWPERVALALPTRSFRGELRDLLMRAVELGLEPQELAALGRDHGRTEWVAAADVLREYDEVTALSAPGAYDPAWVCGAAADLLVDDPEAAERVRRSVRVVVVDDAQELTPAAVRLVRAVVAVAAPDVVLLGDPDAATSTFRGADPLWLATRWTDLAPRGATDTLTLRTAYRTPEAVRETATRVAAHIGVLGDPGHRRAAPGRPGGTVSVHLLRSVAQEAASVAARLRRAHLVEGRPWSEMAVVVRGRARTALLRRVLEGAGVPVGAATADLPVREEAAVRPLLTVLGWVAALAGDGTARPPVDEVADVLTSPLGGADPVAMRRLRRALRREELAAGGPRTSDELLVEALRTPALLHGPGPEAAPARRVARVLEAACAAALDEGSGAWRAGVSAEAVLWAMWDASGLAVPWRSTALGLGAASARADRDLDAVLALLDAAGRFADRLPAAAPDAFLEHVRGQDVPGDTLVARAPAGDAVALLTPQAAAGREWPLVVVAGVQEGVWPDLRLRGSLLGSAELVDVVTGRAGDRRAAQAAVRHDETRLLLVAVTRASAELVVTAVRSADEQPSPYLDVVDPRPEEAGPRPFDDPARMLALPALVGELRREVAGADASRRGAAVTALARLASAGVPGADPARWWPLTTWSDDRPVRPAEAAVTVSPSRVESFTRCALRWLLTTCGADGPARGAADVGTLVHEVAAELPDAEVEELVAAVDARWPRLGMPQGWVSDRKRGEAHAMVERLSRYVHHADGQGFRRVASERSMRVALGRAVLTGRVDRLELGPGGSVRVVDLKTGSSKPKGEEVATHPQLGCYQLAVTRGAFPDLGTRTGGALLVHLGKAGGVSMRSTVQEQPPLEPGDGGGWAEELVARTADGMAAARFPATPGPGCTTCAVVTSCPARAEGRTV
ncbi:MAG TPA: ATP-dependent DNA helicase [Dermatophilaceae bacterium]|nr:ATP-dependent DNA helicase [Dermatophilaceae bacterium]